MDPVPFDTGLEQARMTIRPVILVRPAGPLYRYGAGLADKTQISRHSEFNSESAG